jgi:hypothetical protein
MSFSCNRIQIDEYMFRLEQSQEQHYQEWLKKNRQKRSLGCDREKNEVLR